MATHVINIDWLSLTCYTTRAFKPEGQRLSNYTLNDTGVGSKMWQHIAEVYEPDGVLLGTLSWQPRSSAFPARLSVLQLANNTLYEEGVFERAMSAIVGLGLEYRNINRIDLACDFNEFEGQMLPSDFIEEALMGCYVKVGLTQCMAHYDMHYRTLKKEDGDYMYEGTLTEAEQSFCRHLRGSIRKTEKSTITLTLSEAIQHLQDNIVLDGQPDCDKDNIMLAAQLYRCVPNISIMEFGRQAWTAIRNANLQAVGLPLLPSPQLALLHEKPRPECTSLTFGKAGKCVQVQLYNKSKEMREVRTKPYIVNSWRRGGLDTNKDVWRLEIRLRGEGLQLQNVEQQTYTRLSLVETAFQEQIQQLFYAYMDKYWQWYIYDCYHVKIQNMLRLTFFTYSKQPIKPKRRPKPVKTSLFAHTMASQLDSAASKVERSGGKYFGFILRRAAEYFSQTYEDSLATLDLTYRKKGEIQGVGEKESLEEHLAATAPNQEALETFFAKCEQWQKRHFEHIEQLRRAADLKKQEMQDRLISVDWDAYQRDYEMYVEFARTFDIHISNIVACFEPSTNIKCPF